MTAEPGPISTAHVLAELDDDGVLCTILIAPQVLIEIIDMTAQSEPGGIKAVAPKGIGLKRNHAIRAMDPVDDAGNWYSDRGIKVRIIDQTVDASVSLAVRAGTSVPELAGLGQNRVGTAIEKMLGKQTGPISIQIVEFTAEIERT